MGLNFVQDRVIVSVNMDAKNWHTMSDGTKIRLERRFDNFDQKYTQPINATVISSESIPAGSEIIIHHNSVHDTNKLFSYQLLSGEAIASDIRYFSVPYSECFAWYDEPTESWQPMPGFDFALRVFKPYKGILEGIEPTLLKNVLYVTTGEYKGNVCFTLKAADYELIFQDKDERESRLIRFRSCEDEKTQREMEIVAIDHDLTAKVLNGEYIVGLTKTDAKPLNSYINDNNRRTIGHADKSSPQHPAIISH